MKHKNHYIRELNSMIGQTVKTAGWVHETRDLGKIKFLLLRDATGIVQVTAKKGKVEDSILEAMELGKEDVISIEGTVVEMKNAPNGVELIPTKITVLSSVSRKLPVDPTDKVPSELDTRLDYRYIDLRRKTTRAIFDIVSAIPTAFREKALELGFQEIRPPSIVASSTEGGSNLFPIIYFEREAFLSQSPQLYKQLAIVGGMERVFMLTPAFRAEKHNTSFHLNEVLQMDLEMGFADHHDAMDALEQTALHIVKRVKENCPGQLESLGVELQVPSEVPRYSYTQALEKLSPDFKLEWGDDLSREHEEALCLKSGSEMVMVYEWPTLARAFYSMPNEDDEKICNSYDLLYRGTEISSGAQRIHVPEILIEQLKKRGLNPDNFEFYINAFRYGAPPHAGWSIGLERIAMKICKLSNIREAAMFPRDRTRLVP